MTKKNVFILLPGIVEFIPENMELLANKQGQTPKSPIS